MRRTPIKRRRATPRRRPTDRWNADQWADANIVLTVRSEMACEKCGKECGPVQRHHRKRRRDGGDSLANLYLVGAGCHAEIHAHPAISRKFGWIVSVTADPKTVPVLWRSKEWFLLDDEGNKTLL